MYPFFILILSLAPWNPAYVDALYHMGIEVHNRPCPSSAWTGPGQVIHLCPAPGDDWGRLGLHESQHLLAGRFLQSPAVRWERFAPEVMAALKGGQYKSGHTEWAQDVLQYGDFELHAELPWILHGEIPPELQAWYPWFDLGPSLRITSSQENAPRPI